MLKQNLDHLLVTFSNSNMKRTPGVFARSVHHTTSSKLLHGHLISKVLIVLDTLVDDELCGLDPANPAGNDERCLPLPVRVHQIGSLTGQEPEWSIRARGSSIVDQLPHLRVMDVDIGTDLEQSLQWPSVSVDGSTVKGSQHEVAMISFLDC